MLLLILSACDRTVEFNTYGWTTGANAGFPPSARSEMLSDLLNKHKLVGVPSTDILNLLGEPDEIDSMHLSYKIELEYGSDVDPVYKKDLLLYMDGDSVITDYKVEEQEL